MGYSLSHANRGKSLEQVVIASQGRIVRLHQMSAAAKFIRDRTTLYKPGAVRTGKVIAKKGPVDFIGVVLATGRAIHFDAKQTGEPKGFYMGLLAAHQLYHLQVFGGAGAVAGVVAEATDKGVAAFYWLPEKLLSMADMQRMACIPWGMCNPLGPNSHTINFSHVPEILAQK